jgi:hypothetical protein
LDREWVLAKENPSVAFSNKFFRSSMTPLMVAIQPKLYRPEKMNSKSTTATEESSATTATESSLSESFDWNSGLTTMRSLNRIFNSSIDFQIPYEFLFPDYHAS